MVSMARINVEANGLYCALVCIEYISFGLLGLESLISGEAHSSISQKKCYGLVFLSLHYFCFSVSLHLSLFQFFYCAPPPPLSLFVFRLGYAPQINECHLPTLLFIPVDRSANAGVNRKKSLKSSAKKKKQINRSTRSLAMIKTCVPTNRREWNTLYHTQHGFIIIIIIDTHCLALNSKPHIRKDCISGRTG